MCDRGQVKRPLDRQQVGAAGLVGAAQARQRGIRLAHGAMDVGEVVQRVDQPSGVVDERRHRQGFLERVARGRVIAHALENVARFDKSPATASSS